MKKMYEDSIVLQDVLVEADTEEGTRLTARYVLNEDEVENICFSSEMWTALC